MATMPLLLLQCSHCCLCHYARTSQPIELQKQSKELKQAGWGTAAPLIAVLQSMAQQQHCGLQWREGRESMTLPSQCRCLHCGSQEVCRCGGNWTSHGSDATPVFMPGFSLCWRSDGAATTARGDKADASNHWLCMYKFDAPDCSARTSYCFYADLYEMPTSGSIGSSAGQAWSPMRRARKAELMAYALGRSPGATSSMPGMLLGLDPWQQQQQLVRASTLLTASL